MEIENLSNNILDKEDQTSESKSFDLEDTKESSVKLKEKQVSGLVEQISNAKTLMIVSIKSLPSKQFQEIKKSLRKHAVIKVVKKNIMDRAIKAFGKESILELGKYIKSDCAFVISDLEGFELAGILAGKKTPVFAKVGQIATEDIEVKAGPTDLVPGPAISELGSLGLQVAVEDGKISIKGSKVVINKGQVINENAASLFQKLNIQPFNIGLEVSVAYDVEDEKIYTNIKIDVDGYTEELKSATGKALGFAQKIVYYCKETIGYFLAKANAEGNKLESFVKEENVEEKKEDEKKEEVKEEEKEESIDNTTLENEGQVEPNEESNPKDVEDTEDEKGKEEEK